MTFRGTVVIAPSTIEEILISILVEAAVTAALPRTWTKPSQSAPTVEDADDPVLGWAAQYTAGPTQAEAYAPWADGYAFRTSADIANPTVDPTAGTSGTGGTLAADTYVYAYSFGTLKSETLVSNTVSQATTGSTSTVTLTLPAIPGGAWYDRLYVYRETAGVLQRIGSATTTSFVDHGTVTPTIVAQTTAPSTASFYEVNH